MVVVEWGCCVGLDYRCCWVVVRSNCYCVTLRCDWVENVVGYGCCWVELLLWLLLLLLLDWVVVVVGLLLG